MDKVRIGVAHRGAGLAPVFAALDGGGFAAEGIEPDLVPCTGHPRALEALHRGEVDFVNSVGPEVLLFNARHGGDSVVIASAIGRSAQQISARPGLATRESLRGKRWGITTRYDADDCTIRMVFDRWGWDVERDARIVVVGTDRPRLDALLDPAQVDVAIMHAPEPFQAARRGWTLIEDLGRLDYAFQNSCAVTTRRLVARDADLARRYAAAFCRGVWRFRTDARFGLEVLRTHTGERDERVLEQTWTLFARLMGGMMFPSVEGMRNAAQVLHQLGAVDRAPAPEESIDLAQVAALEQDGFFDRLMGTVPA
jgi:hypothetical protein